MKIGGLALAALSCHSQTGQDAAVAARMADIRCVGTNGDQTNSHTAERSEIWVRAKGRPAFSPDHTLAL